MPTSNTGSTVEVDGPRIVVTAGEPAGVGPDLVLALARHPTPAAITVIGDPDLLRERAALLGVTVDIVEVDGPGGGSGGGRLTVLPQRLAAPVSPGAPDPANAEPVLESLRRAVHGCLAGDWDALVTAPVNKAVINQGGTPFSGHTEFIGALCEGAWPVMMLTDGALRVALVTTHLPLRAVSAALTRERLQQTLLTLDRDLRDLFGLARPRLLVCGLNPHAGEQGHLGDEEQTVIEPVLAALRARGLDLTGPVPADTAFTPASLEGMDAVVAMYHDQGLPVLKARAFGAIVNVTLGLPLIRTSVDHGTALALAGSGRARADSLLAAVDCAVSLAGRGTRRVARRGAAGSRG
jgi:4-hydroxythreonine-4-phosphate dehydrogenase